MKSIISTMISAILLFSCNDNPNGQQSNSEDDSATTAKTVAVASMYYGGDIMTMEGDSASYAESIVVKDESITLQQTGGSIVCQFHARDLHLVMGPSTSGQSIRFKVLIDGEIPGFDHGDDVDRNGIGIVTEQRLYQLIRHRKTITSRRFEILFLDPAVEAFAFTFG